MYDIEAVRNLARAVLTVAMPTGVLDTSLCDRAERLLRNVTIICQFEEVSAKKPVLDMFCLQGATLFSDAGLARCLDRQWQCKDEPGRLADGEQLLDICEQVVEERLGAVLERARMLKISRIIRESASGRARTNEAMILSDARNLDDMGAAGIFNELRRYVMGGRGVTEAVGLWRVKMDYRYWEARLKDSFYFESVRQLARQRLAAAESFMRQLEHEHMGRDISEMLGDLAS